MVTIASDVEGRTVPLKFNGLSTDEKPVGKFGCLKITNASSFYEMDTKKVFLYDEQNGRWLEQ